MQRWQTLWQRPHATRDRYFAQLLQSIPQVTPDLIITVVAGDSVTRWIAGKGMESSARVD